MASSITLDTATFFTKGTPEQFEFVLNLYTEALRLKAERKNKKPEELIKLDCWYQNELPPKIKSRGKDRHLIHEELVQTMKWKLARGKFYPQLSYLIKVNTPKAVMSETRKAFKKLPNLEQAITALSNLKGVGTTMASALLAAAAPELAPFMADECLMAIPDFEGIDYTTKEYLNFVQHIKTVVDRLNKEAQNPEAAWDPHRVELALWTHYVVAENKPELLEEEPPKNGNSHHAGAENGIVGTKPEEAISDDSTQDTSSKDSPAPPPILSPDDSLLDPPTTEDSLGTAEEESSSRDCSLPTPARDLRETTFPSEEACDPTEVHLAPTGDPTAFVPTSAPAEALLPLTEAADPIDPVTDTPAVVPAEAPSAAITTLTPSAVDDDVIEKQPEEQPSAEQEPPTKRVKVDD